MTTVPSGYEIETVFEEGRGVPYTQLGDWVNHAGISDRAARIYWTLCEHLNVRTGSREVWPAQGVLAKVVGIKRAADVAPAIDELVIIGAVEIRAEYDPSGRQVRNRYIIHRAPADNYVGPRSLAEFYKLLRADEGRRYEAWFTARRKEIADGLERLKRERKDADTRAKAEAARRALGGAEVRTPGSPAETRITACQVGVRDSSRGGAGFRTAGVRDPALEQDEVEQDESLSRRVPKQTRQQPPAPPVERENPAAPKNDEAQQVAAAWAAARGGPRVRKTENSIATATAALLADGHDLDHLCRVAAWMATRNYIDLDRAITHPDAPKPANATVRAISRPLLPDWCGHCADGNSDAATNPARRFINNPDGTSSRCHCHPAGARQAA